MSKDQEMEIKALIAIALEESVKSVAIGDFKHASFYASEAAELMGRLALEEAPKGPLH